MSAYLIPAATARAETYVMNSRFITSVARASTIEEARTFIANTQAEFKDASHNVPAYIVGFGSTTIEHCTDAGEPAGTAGRPILAVLKGSQVGDIVMVVTRYFGGTKLGTGGLVRAYTDAAKAGIQSIRLAQKVNVGLIEVEIDYTYYELVKRLHEQARITVLQENFAARVGLVVQVRAENIPGYLEEISKCTHRTGTVLILSENETTILPVETTKS